MRPSHDEYGLRGAEWAASRATCLRRAVGCVLTNVRHQVLATGYNGRAAGLPHCNQELIVCAASDMSVAALESGATSEVRYPHACAGARSASGTNLDACEAIHAEQNALLQCGDVYAIETCYVTVSPCVTCVKLLLNTSCRRIVFRMPYAHNEEAQRLWLTARRAWHCLVP